MRNNRRDPFEFKMSDSCACPRASQLKMMIARALNPADDSKARLHVQDDEIPFLDGECVIVELEGSGAPEAQAADCKIVPIELSPLVELATELLDGIAASGKSAHSRLPGMPPPREAAADDMGRRGIFPHIIRTALVYEQGGPRVTNDMDGAFRDLAQDLEQMMTAGSANTAST